MTRSVFTKWLWDARRGIVGWSLALVVVGCGYAAFWPTINNPDLLRALESYPKAVLEALNYRDFATPAGYLNATVYGMLVGLLLVVFGVATGTRLVAGDEEAGTLDLVLAHPVSRTSLALQRFAALVVTVVIMSAVLWVGIALLRGPARLEGITLGDLAAMHVHVVAFGVLFGAIAFATGAATGSRTLALAVGAGTGILAYAASGLLPQVAGLAWVRGWSAFTWLNGSEPLRNGLDLGHLGLMLGLSAALVALGTAVFVRRDIGAG
jgi:ABC-2 type transport system permease protein